MTVFAHVTAVEAGDFAWVFAAGAVLGFVLGAVAGRWMLSRRMFSLRIFNRSIFSRGRRHD